MTVARKGLTKLPVDAEARGKVRAWKADTAKKFAAINRVWQSAETERLNKAFLYKGKTGRDRALKQLQTRLKGAALELQDMDDRFAVWSYLRPRDSVIEPGRGRDPGRWQKATVVHYFMVTRKPEPQWGQGLWTMEAPDHALERLVQRDRNANITQALIEAHGRIKGLTANAQTLTTGRQRFYLPAGNGVFVCELGHCRLADVNLFKFWVILKTWYHQDTLTEDIEKRIVKSDPRYLPGGFHLLDAKTDGIPLWPLLMPAPIITPILDKLCGKEKRGLS